MSKDIKRSYSGDFPPGLWTVLQIAFHAGGLAVQGDHAREFATEVALAASLGWLSNINPDGRTYGKRWRCTVGGTQALTYKEHLQ